MSAAAVVRGTAADLAAIMPVMARAFDARFGEAWNESQCLGMMAMPGSMLFIAGGEEAAGFALSRCIAGESELLLLAVCPEMRRRGYGRALLGEVVATARLSGARSVFLEVRSGNEAVTLYSSAGFAPVGRRPGYYRGSDGQIFDALTFRLMLS